MQNINQIHQNRLKKLQSETDSQAENLNPSGEGLGNLPPNSSFSENYNRPPNTIDSDMGSGWMNGGRIGGGFGNQIGLNGNINHF